MAKQQIKAYRRDALTQYVTPVLTDTALKTSGAWLAFIGILYWYLMLQSLPGLMLKQSNSQHPQVMLMWLIGWLGLLATLRFIKPQPAWLTPVKWSKAFGLTTLTVVGLFGSQMALSWFNRAVSGQVMTPNNAVFEALLNQPQLTLLVMIDALVLGPLTEELVFRQWCIERLLARRSVGTRIGISSALFATIHLTSTPVGWLIYFVCGCLLATLYVKTRQLRWSFGAHMLINLAALL
ncbi:CPBP family intramembrane glutamic endopeptidase [Furfurilactobacillus entadae]|uniref:CPBP family intramembrane glutamic endopeptidase n=1 Tax=Furfurilactobacillus entadae TaxID=2922307 RepID=UPI0038B34C71